MPKHKFKILCNTFTFLENDNKGYSTWAKESKHIEWVHEGHGSGGQQRVKQQVQKFKFLFIMLLNLKMKKLLKYITSLILLYWMLKLLHQLNN